MGRKPTREEIDTYAPILDKYAGKRGGIRMTYSLYDAKREAAMTWLRGNLKAMENRARFLIQLRQRWDAKFKNNKWEDRAMCNVVRINTNARHLLLLQGMENMRECEAAQSSREQEAENED